MISKPSEQVAQDVTILCFVQEAGQLHSLRVELHFASLYFGKVKDVVDERQQVMTTLMDDADLIFLRGVETTIP